MENDWPPPVLPMVVVAEASTVTAPARMATLGALALYTWGFPFFAIAQTAPVGSAVSASALLAFAVAVASITVVAP